MTVDSFVNDPSAFCNVTFGRIRTICGLTFISMSALLTKACLGGFADVGLGTVVMAQKTEAGVHAANDALSGFIAIQPWSGTLGAMAR